MSATHEDLYRAAEKAWGEADEKIIRLDAVGVIYQALLAERERCAKIAEDYSIIAHAAHDMKSKSFPEKSPVHGFIASAIRSPQV